jgi:uncharacterized cupredoxin-like copper-binding protein
MNSYPVRWLAAVAAVGALVAAGCGDDGDDEASDDAATEESTDTTAPDTDEGDLAAYCDAEVAIESAPEPEIDFETASPEQQAEALRAYGSETLRPLADDVVASAPDELAADIEVLSAAVDELAASGDFAVFEQPEVEAASDNVHAFDLENCGWATQPVTASDYAFEGLPADLGAGPTSFELTNEGEELHELVLARKNDGVTLSAEELLALPEEEAMNNVTPVGSPAFAAPGDSGYLVVDLEPGDYVGLCFIPVGMTSEDAPPPEGPPHAMQGMVAEFTVS